MYITYDYYNIITFIPAVVMVAWEQQMYEIFEDQGMQNVCVILTGETERAVQIGIETTDGTATGSKYTVYLLNASSD